jgi:transposase-like protein
MFLLGTQLCQKELKNESKKEGSLTDPTRALAKLASDVKEVNPTLKQYFHYPEDIKETVVSLYLASVPLRVVAGATGLRKSTLSLWVKQASKDAKQCSPEPKMGVRELRVRSDVREPLARTTLPGQSAMIHLPNGLRVEIPLVALTANLIAQIGGPL